MKEKKFSFLSFLLMVYFLLPLGAQQVSVDVSMPEKGVAGEKIPVKVTIHKGDYTDFARFRQVLPNGFDVHPVETANSDFTLKNGELNFIWLKLPQEKVVTLKYELIPDKRLRGIYQITGLFSYISDQERQELTVPERSIEIEPAEDVPASPVVAASPAVTTGLKAAAGPAAFRGVPVKDADGKSWIIRLIINRGPMEKLGKLEESIPAGYLPENIHGNGAIFSYREGLVKYIWMNFPEDSVFEVSYKLVPLKGTSSSVVPEVTGEFSYMQDDVSKRHTVQMLSAEVPANADEAMLYALTAAVPAATSIAAAAPPPAAAKEETPPPATANTEPTTPAQETVPAPENRPGQPTEIVEHAPQKSEGVYFRVQLLATAHPVEMEKYFRKHNVPGRIYKEYTNGLYKYTTGTFTSYREARAFVQRLKETTDIDEAFVTAYDDGRRITVREALNRTGQKWFK